MEEKNIIQLYQEAIALLSFRNGGIEIFGDYETNENGKVRLVIRYVMDGLVHRMSFKYSKDHTSAVKIFIKYSQNLYKLR